MTSIQQQISQMKLANIARIRRRSIWYRLLSHREAQAGLVLLLILVGIALFGPLITPYNPDTPNYRAKLLPPSTEHWLGTDQSGRDLFSRVLIGARNTLGSAILILGLIVGVGVVLGAIAGMIGGIVDTIIMRIVDITMAIPSMVLAIAIVGIFGPGFQNLILALVIAWWAYYARLTRSYVLTARQRLDILAARLAGISWGQILLSHILPGATANILVVATLDLGSVITAIAGLSFLGLGMQPPTAEWGAMLSDARFFMSAAPWMLLGPLIPIILAVIATNLLGNALRDILDPGRIR